MKVSRFLRSIPAENIDLFCHWESYLTIFIFEVTLSLWFSQKVTYKIQASKTVPDGHLPGQIGMIRRVVLNKDNEHGLGLAVIGKIEFFDFLRD